MKRRCFEKIFDIGKDWEQEEKGVAEYEMVRWQWLNGHEFKQALGYSGGHKRLTCCSPGSCNVQTWFSNWTPPLTIGSKNKQTKKQTKLKPIQWPNCSLNKKNN